MTAIDPALRAAQPATDATAPRPEADRFAELYRREYGDLLAFVSRRTLPSRAEDIVHETFVTAWQRIADLPRDPSDARPWLFTVARNHLLHDVRGQERRSALWIRLAQASADAIPGHEDEVASSVDLAAAWNRLSAAQQEVIALAGFEGLTSAEAGQVLGISAVAYRLRLRKARAALRAALAEGELVPKTSPPPNRLRSPQADAIANHFSGG